jgi:HEAT repeat protein
MNAEIEALFGETLVGDYDADAPWAAVRELRRIASSEVFDIASNWCRSQNPLERARGADVLAQLGRTAEHPDNCFAEESYSAVSAMIENETDVLPLISAVYALGHIYDPRAIPLIIRFAQHPEAEVRFAVACALGHFPNDDLSARPLLALTEDVDEDVRDWATFGLGVQGNLDSPEIRDALAKRLSDPFSDARQEAMAALAKRRDTRVLLPLLQALEKPLVSNCEIEAAYLMLGFAREKEGWDKNDYAEALKELYGPAAGQPSA